MSALRERGWRRPDQCRDAEPQRLVNNSNRERKTDTMKTYILRDPDAVEPQKPRPADAATAAMVEKILVVANERVST